MVALAAVGVPAAVVASLRPEASGRSSPEHSEPAVLVLDGGELGRVDTRRYNADERLERTAFARAVRAALPRAITLRQGQGRVFYGIQRDRTVARALREARGGGELMWRRLGRRALAA